ncbi:MAG: hypothetical protein HY924_15825 [Elusimicrobia bacterium]|nr:hypothetical protein [Elusimicrobiota bacterium]
MKLWLALLLPACWANAASPTNLEFPSSAPLVADACANALSRARSALTGVITISDTNRDFTNTPDALETALADLSEATDRLIFLQHVSTSTKVQDKARACESQVRKFAVATFSRPDLLAGLRGYARLSERLAGEPKALVPALLAEFDRHGAGLGPEQRERLSLVRDAISELEARFLKNIETANQLESLSFAPDQLAGLPQAVLDELPLENGLVRVNPAGPVFDLLMSHCTVTANRRFLAGLEEGRAKDNIPLLTRLLGLRQEHAELLGRASHLRLATETFSLNTPSAIEWSMSRLHSGLKGPAKTALAELAKMKTEHQAPKLERGIQAWDARYYSRLLKEAASTPELDQLENNVPLRPFLDGMPALALKLYGARLSEVREHAAWHPEVRLYAVFMEPYQESPVGYIYTDLYARPEKPEGTFASSLARPRRLADSSRRPGVAALVADLGRTPRQDQAFITMDQASSLLRAFGKALYLVSSQNRFAMFSASEAPKDFIDVPGLLFERWAWSAMGMSLVYPRLPDASALPPEASARIQARRRVLASLEALRELGLAELDRRLHSSKVANPCAEHRDIAASVSLVPAFPEACAPAGFSFIATEPGTRFSKLWARVVAEDLFQRFGPGDRPDPILARRFRKAVLDPGTTQDPALLVRAFLERKPMERPFIKASSALPLKKVQ